MEQNMAKITDKGLQSKPEKEKWLSDDPVKGHGQLEARVTKAGRSYFYFRYSHLEKQDRYRLGLYDPKGIKGLTLKQARLKALECRQLYLSGTTDVKGCYESEARLKDAKRVAEEARLEAEQKEAEARLTVQELFGKWQKHTLSKYKDGGKEITRLFDKDILPIIGSLPADAICKGHITGITDTIEERGANRMAKVAFTSMKGMFKYAYNRDHITKNPTEKLSKSDIGGKDVERDRVLSDEEIHLLAKKMQVSGLLPTAKAAVWICLSTCCRIGELLKAEWKHVDLEKNIWTIPIENSKNNLPLSIYMSAFTLKQFEVIKSINHDTPWLFPNRSKEDHVDTKTITKQVGDRQRQKPMRNRSTKADSLILTHGKWTLHDMRRTGATMMGALGINPEIIDRCQNHKEPNKIRRTYQHYNYAPEMKKAWMILGERLEVLVRNKDSAKVILIKRASHGE